MSILLGHSNSSITGLADSSSLALRLVLDTGSGDVFLYNKSACLALSTNTDADCADDVRSPSLRTYGVPQGLVNFGVTIDGESFLFSESKITTGWNKITLPTQLIGTNQNGQHAHDDAP